MGEKPTSAADTRHKRVLTFLEPTENRLVVSKERGMRLPQTRKTEGGIILPVASEFHNREHGLFAVVEKVGPAVVGAFAPGDTVFVATYAGIPVYSIDTSFDIWLITEADILAKVDGAVWDLMNEEL